MKRIVLALLLLMWSPASYGQTERLYACAMAAASGFNPDKNASEPRFGMTAFRERRFILRFSGKRANLKFSGESTVEDNNCTTPWTSQPELHQCVEKFAMFVFDEKLLRFSYATLFGYVQKSKDSLQIAYGDCQAF